MRPLLALILLALPLPAAAESSPSAPTPAAAPAPAARIGVCVAPRLFGHCGKLGSPCCLGTSFYFDPKIHRLPYALNILARVADRDPEEARRQLSRLRDIGRLRSADSLRLYPKLAALYASLT